MKTLVTDGFDEDSEEWCDADDMALMRLTVAGIVQKAIRQREAGKPPAVRLKLRAWSEVRALPLRITKVRVVIKHDGGYVETHEGYLHARSPESSAFSVCVGGEHWQDKFRWIGMAQPGCRVSIFEVMD